MSEQPASPCGRGSRRIGASRFPQYLALASRCNLTFRPISRSISLLHLPGSWSIWLLISQALASDHVVETIRGRRGRKVRRLTSGEENDATDCKH
jgi:hypothetical protein